MIKDTNYINIPGWAVTKLGLKGNSLIVFSVIYGFSQIEGHYFNGSLQYLCEWTNSTRQGVLKNLNELVDLGYILKQECSPTNIYYVNKDIINDVNLVTVNVNSVTTDVNLVDETSKLSSHNNINNNINNIDNKYIKNKELNAKIESIITYLNHTCDTHFRTSTEASRKVIRRHLNEGFTENDFKKVVDSKYAEWGVSPKLFNNGILSSEYLRPTTLFGDKFEAYLHEAELRESSEVGGSISAPLEPEITDIIF